MIEIQTGIPEEVGIPSEAILRFLMRLDRYQIPMHSVQLMRKEKLIFEGYYAPFKKGQLHRMFSVSKSFTAVAIGKLEEEGRISLGDPIIKYFPEYCTEKLHPWIRMTTIQNMLEMRTCHSATTYKCNLDENWVESFFLIPPDHKPGTVFHYDTSSSHVLCALVEKLTGKPMLEYLKETVLYEIGFSKESYMLKDPFGTSMGGSGLMATPEDLLRFGILLMHNGKVDGRQLVNRTFLKEATECRVENMVKGPTLFERQGYGYQIWQGQYGSFLCYGMGGQFIICLPEKQLLCVTTADTQGIGGGNQLIQNCFYEEILPVLSGEALPRNKKEYMLLQDYAEKLQVRPLSYLKGKKRIECYRADINGKTYKMTQNTQGFEEMGLVLEESGDGILAFVLSGKTYHIRFGFDSVAVDNFPIQNMQCASSGMWLDSNTFYIRTFLLDEACGSIHFQLFFGDDDLTVYMKKDDDMLFREFTGHIYGRLP